MHFSTIFGLAASVASVHALSKGFNSGSTKTDGTPKSYSDFAAEFKKAQNLPGTSGWNGIRLYTMIQGGTTDDPIAAIKAAIETKTEMLLGLWASAGEETIKNELSALSNALDTYGSEFADLVVGISVGSEDLYRNSETGMTNDAGVGVDPDIIVDYIKRTRKAISGTALSDSPIGHVDTWDAWQNGTNSEVVDNCDWLGMDTYPFFEYQKSNSIKNAEQLFYDALDITEAAAGGKDVWITETGWPVSGESQGDAVPSTENAETYWQEIACALEGKYHVFWYTLQDANTDPSNPSFGIIGSDISSQPKYDLSCDKKSKTTSSSMPTMTVMTSTNSDGDVVTMTTAAGSAGTASATGTGSVFGGANSTVPAATGAPTTVPAASTDTSDVDSESENAAATTGPAITAAIFAVFGLIAVL